MVHPVEARAERVCHDDAESVAAHVLVEAPLVDIIGGEVEEQLFRLELLAGDEGGYGGDLADYRSLSTPECSVGHRGHPLAPS